jgi:hypothetical protein
MVGERRQDESVGDVDAELVTASTAACVAVQAGKQPLSSRRFGAMPGHIIARETSTGHPNIHERVSAPDRVHASGDLGTGVVRPISEPMQRPTIKGVRQHDCMGRAEEVAI